MDYAKTVIYMADDDADDRYFMRQSLQEVYPWVTVVEAQDGSELLTLLDTWSQQPAPQPVHLILLDVNMPKVNGLEALRAIKANPLLRHIPAVMLSTSVEPAQMATAYQNGASMCLEKPHTYAHLNQISRSVSGFL
ncbi:MULTISPECIES: response regulator [Spirosoma]|uniref:Response regulator n=1 Tax=Spirosoma liriopis TaxID=2937440 RepID=A0ABT0HTW2_9BACT|nr:MULTISPECIES: response regulator [Spirosoma]MCK8495606.1 response regulator [Spirosoma liriopis]UHG94542.1 response regulator [Spirosoma oryzicola]